MNRKIIATASIIAIIAIVFTATSNSTLDESTISKTIFVDAVYEPESEIVKITYNDNSKKTNLATLEILGMEETFHKEFSQSSFIEIVQINSEPKYGWSTIPVVFSINHNEFGEIGLKTEIYEQGELKPRIIYSKI
jgi:inner membrane protein involved in colicin E2 resistance